MNRYLRNDIRWLTLALGVLLMVVVLAGNAAQPETGSGVVPDGIYIATAASLDLDSVGLDTGDRIVFEPAVIGLIGMGLVVASRRRRHQLARQR